MSINVCAAFGRQPVKKLFFCRHQLFPASKKGNMLIPYGSHNSICGMNDITYSFDLPYSVCAHLGNRPGSDGVETSAEHLGVMGHRGTPAKRIVQVGVQFGAGFLHASRAYSSSAIRGASRLKIQTASAHTPR